MTSLTTGLKSHTWTKDTYLITTNSSLIPVAAINAAFASKEMYWCYPLPEAAVRELLSQSLTFGVFEIPASSSSPSQPPAPETETGTDTNATALPPNATFIGLGRIVTDFTTMAYLTDIYINPAHQGRGLGRWLLACMQECLASMPHLRGSLLFTGDWRRSVPLYEEVLGMRVNEGRRTGEGGEGLASMLRTWKGSPLHEDNEGEIPRDH